MQSDKDREVDNIVKDVEVENPKVFFGEDTMARFVKLSEVFEELEKITSHKEIVGKIADFF